MLSQCTSICSKIMIGYSNRSRRISFSESVYLVIARFTIFMLPLFQSKHQIYVIDIDAGTYRQRHIQVSALLNIWLVLVIWHQDKRQCRFKKLNPHFLLGEPSQYIHVQLDLGI